MSELHLLDIQHLDTEAEQLRHRHVNFPERAERDEAIAELARLAAEIDANMKMLDDFQNTPVETPTVPPVTVDKPDGPEEETTKGSRTNFSVDSLDRGSESALKAIFAAGAGAGTPEKALNVAKQQLAAQKAQLAEQKKANRPVPEQVAGAEN